jgi:N-acetylglucosamine malate deacetylase 1
LERKSKHKHIGKSDLSEIVLVVAAHPDDEVLGVGGTVAWHVANGDTVHILIVAEGATSRTDADDQALAELAIATNLAAAALGAQEPRLLGLRDNRLDGYDLIDIIQPIERIMEIMRPTVVYTHFGADLNVDHRLVHDAVVTACRPVPGQSVRSIYTFETVSSTEWGTRSAFCPVRFVDVSDHMAAKMKALECYEIEMRPFPHARSLQAVRALAQLRGSAVGIEAVEAFEVVRQVERSKPGCVL